ncbi:MAG: hypothetical protein ABIJ45_06155 [Candidatus Zixiibacteriota bacterium]
MYTKIVLAIVFVFFINSSIFSQSKVGNSTGNTLSLSPSVSSLGMGEVGVSLANEKSMYLNPGCLGLYFKENNLSLSGYPGNNEIFYINFFNASLSLPVKKYVPEESSLIYGIGFYYSNAYYFVEETNPYFPDGTGNFYKISYKNYNLVLSGAYCDNFEIGSGLTIKYVDENNFSVSASAVAFDWGVVARVPIVSKFNSGGLSLITIPAVGFSLSNFGDSYDINNSGYETDPEDGDLQGDIPTTTRYGFSTEIGLQKNYDNGYKRKLLNLILSHDWEKSDALTEDARKIGWELSLGEMVSLRAGKIYYDIDTETLGFSLSTKGIFRLFKSSYSVAKGNRRSFISFMQDKLEIKYSYAKNSYEDDYYPSVKYHELIANIALR